eukprot:UN02166
MAMKIDYQLVISCITLFLCIYIGFVNGQTQCDGSSDDEHFCDECITGTNLSGCVICQPAYLTTADCRNCGSCKYVWWFWLIMAILILFSIISIIVCICRCCFDILCCCCNDDKRRG